MYSIEVEHKGLGKYKVIRGRDKYSVELRADEQIRIWNEMYQRKLDKELKALEKEQKLQEKQDNVRHTATLNKLNKKILDNLNNFLLNIIKKDHRLYFEDLKDKSEFKDSILKNNNILYNITYGLKNLAKKPEKPQKVKIDKYIIVLIIRKYFNLIKKISNAIVNFYTKKFNILKLLLYVFIPHIILIHIIFLEIACVIVLFYLPISIIDRYVIFPKRLKKRNNLYKEQLKNWKKECKVVRISNLKVSIEYFKNLKEYLGIKKEFYENRNQVNRSIANELILYKKLDTICVENYFDNVLSRVKLPEVFINSYELEYNNETKTVVIDYLVPEINDLPDIKEYKYIERGNNIKETLFSEKEKNVMYDNLIYQTIFTIPYVLCQSDYANALESIVINIAVDTIDKTIGKPVHLYIASLQISKEKIEEINFELFDPKQAFKKFKGVACANFEEMVAIAPISRISKDDSRFIDSYNVIDNINSETNLAGMDWKDFENLIRDVFEKEYCQDGCECKITQSSWDKGVDAIVFDPDPIRGGKIVIQAKRYTNIVGASAVRDLYGTVVNEGAIKGILVTTSDYGPESREFANNKPLTLINGNELLYLLKKHGYNAYINIKEIKNK